MSKHATINFSRHAHAALIQKVHNRMLEHCNVLLNFENDMRALRESTNVQSVPRMHWVGLEVGWWEMLDRDGISETPDGEQAFALFAQARTQGPYRAERRAWPCAHEAIEFYCGSVSNDIRDIILHDLPSWTEWGEIAAREHKMIDAELRGDYKRFLDRMPYCTTIGKALAKRFRQLRRVRLPDVDDLFGECVWEYLQACRVLGIVGQYSATTRGHRFDSRNRDACIYKWMTKGETLKTILNRVKEHDEWEELYTVQSISAAAKRFAERHGMAWPIQR